MIDTSNLGKEEAAILARRFEEAKRKTGNIPAQAIKSAPRKADIPDANQPTYSKQASPIAKKIPPTTYKPKPQAKKKSLEQLASESIPLGLRLRIAAKHFREYDIGEFLSSIFFSSQKGKPTNKYALRHLVQGITLTHGIDTITCRPMADYLASIPRYAKILLGLEPAAKYDFTKYHKSLLMKILEDNRIRALLEPFAKKQIAARYPNLEGELAKIKQRYSRAEKIKEHEIYRIVQFIWELAYRTEKLRIPEVLGYVSEVAYDAYRAVIPNGQIDLRQVHQSTENARLGLQSFLLYAHFLTKDTLPIVERMLKLEPAQGRKNPAIQEYLRVTEGIKLSFPGPLERIAQEQAPEKGTEAEGKKAPEHASKSFYELFRFDLHVLKCIFPNSGIENLGQYNEKSYALPYFAVRVYPTQFPREFRKTVEALSVKDPINDALIIRQMLVDGISAFNSQRLDQILSRAGEKNYFDEEIRLITRQLDETSRYLNTYIEIITQIKNEVEHGASSKRLRPLEDRCNAILKHTFRNISRLRMQPYQGQEPQLADVAEKAAGLLKNISQRLAAHLTEEVAKALAESPVIDLQEKSNYNLYIRKILKNYLPFTESRLRKNEKLARFPKSALYQLEYIRVLERFSKMASYFLTHAQSPSVQAEGEVTPAGELEKQLWSQLSSRKEPAVQLKRELPHELMAEYLSEMPGIKKREYLASEQFRRIYQEISQSLAQITFLLVQTNNLPKIRELSDKEGKDHVSDAIKYISQAIYGSTTPEEDEIIDMSKGDFLVITPRSYKTGISIAERIRKQQEQTRALWDFYPRIDDNTNTGTLTITAVSGSSYNNLADALKTIEHLSSQSVRYSNSVLFIKANRLMKYVPLKKH